jgi:hypothetical protein
MTTMSNYFDLNDPSEQWVARVQKTPQFDDIKESIQQELAPKKVPPVFYELLIRELTAPLGKDVGDLLVDAWVKRDEIKAYRNRDRYPNENGYEVIMLDHSFSAKQTQYIQPVINNIKILKKLKFDLVLKLNLKSAVLKIRNGAIEEIRAGSFTGSGEIKFEDVKVLEQETRSVKIPLKFIFEPARPI